jgi:hypothetical protein
VRLKRLKTGVSALALTAASVVVTALPAAAATAPSCVHLYQWTETPNNVYYSYARAYNDCKGTVRFRLIWAWAVDDPCVQVDPGHSITSRRLGRPPYVSEVRAC